MAWRDVEIGSHQGTARAGSLALLAEGYTSFQKDLVA